MDRWLQLKLMWKRGFFEEECLVASFSLPKDFGGESYPVCFKSIGGERFALYAVERSSPRTDEALFYDPYKPLLSISDKERDVLLEHGTFTFPKGGKVYLFEK